MPESCFGGLATGGTATGDAAASGGLNPIFMIVLLVGLFAMMIIPQRRRQKKVKDMLDAVKSGDRIKTIGGFYGKVESVKEDLVVLVCDPDATRLTISKSAVATVQNADVENDTEPAAK